MINIKKDVCYSEMARITYLLRKIIIADISIEFHGFDKTKYGTCIDPNENDNIK